MKSSQPRGSFDWDDAKARLQKLADLIDQREQLLPEQAKALMDRRAKELACVPSDPDAISEVVEVLVLSLAGERFAIPTRSIREVFQAPFVTPVPGTPDYLLGVANLRGEVLAVVDFHQLFGLSETPFKTHAIESIPMRLVVFGHERAEFAAPSDEGTEVTTLQVAEILDPDGSLVGVLRDFARGVTKEGVMVLDDELLMNDARLIFDDSTG
ncbi:chemotaxis protein CheW [Aporhodopirellula aestuarii]|uniref:Chemotaxis protein CheW n=1 Tax=Aporhodopirellula aestuarii TaxID=2950107 RepID=A0ABT0U9P3_9BACT|nr:chemotaxis protein CheW [Aporhodopirellula aestuarii]MCM2373608.1 chemotaxis protein CheW [Aporhodopirellula aestuarii]